MTTVATEPVPVNQLLQAWQIAFRHGIAPCLSTAGLETLRVALERNDRRLAQDLTTDPPPLQCLADCPVERCCAVCFAGWQGDKLQTVAEVEEFFALTCARADERLGEPTAVRYFLNWWDTVPREQARRELLAEVIEVLARRWKESA